MEKNIFSKALEVKKLASNFLFDSEVMSVPDSLGVNAPLAYCTKAKGSNLYKIVRNAFAKSTMFYMHEFGHIYFGHMKFDEIKVENIKQKLLNNSKIVENHIIASTLKAKKSIYERVCRDLLNIAMDMEVNSKFFTLEEEPLMVKALNATHYKMLKERSMTEAKNFEAAYKKNPKANGLRPILVSDYGFPRGLSYDEYVLLMFQDLEKFLGTYIVLLNHGKSGQMDADDLLKKIEGRLDVAGEGKESERDGRSEQGSHIERDIKNVPAKGFFQEAKRFIVENSVTHLQDHRQNTLYNYNRGKTKDVLIPKAIEHSKIEVGNVYALVDVSGSVSWDKVNKMISTFKEIASKVGSKSKVIFWDTELEKMVSFKDIKKDIRTPTGGTLLARGIKFIKELSNKKNDKLFIISDFEDSLDEWNAALKGYKGSSFGIQYMSNFADTERANLKKVLRLVC